MNELKGIDPIPGYLELSPSEVPKPPVKTRTQNLPFKLMSALISDYGEACEKAEISQNRELLEPIMKELEKMKGL